MRNYIIAFTMILLTTSIFAQKDSREERREQIKALQIAFITEKLSLTPEESQKFWPIQNKYEENSRAIKSKAKPSKTVEEFTDKEAMDYVEAKIRVDEQQLVLRKKYVQDLKTVLPPKKIAQLFMVEHEFKRKMLKNIKERRGDKRQSGDH